MKKVQKIVGKNAEGNLRGIIKVKKGYNPNSSSIGSDIVTFLSFAAGSGMVTAFLFNLFNPIDKTIKKELKEDNQVEK